MLHDSHCHYESNKRWQLQSQNKNVSPKIDVNIYIRHSTANKENLCV